MGRNKKPESELAKIHVGLRLTTATYMEIKKAADENCRPVSQEILFRIKNYQKNKKIRNLTTL